MKTRHTPYFTMHVKWVPNGSISKGQKLKVTSSVVRLENGFFWESKSKVHLEIIFCWKTILKRFLKMYSYFQLYIHVTYATCVQVSPESRIQDPQILSSWNFCGWFWELQLQRINAPTHTHSSTHMLTWHAHRHTYALSHIHKDIHEYIKRHTHADRDIHTKTHTENENKNVFNLKIKVIVLI